MRYFDTDLSFQAAQRVVSSPKEEAMKVLRDISQNFPSQARSLVKTTVSPDLRKEIKKNQKVKSFSELKLFVSRNFKRHKNKDTLLIYSGNKVFIIFIGLGTKVPFRTWRIGFIHQWSTS